MSKSRPMIEIPLEVALVLDRVFLPKNPNKMRVAHPSVVEAVREFKRILDADDRHDHLGTITDD